MKFSLKNGTFIFLIFIIFPEILTYWYNKTYNNDFQYTFQYITGFIILFSSLYLIILSSKGLKRSIGKERYSRIAYIVFSALSLAYIIFMLFVQYAFQNISIG